MFKPLALSVELVVQSEVCVLQSDLDDPTAVLAGQPDKRFQPTPATRVGLRPHPTEAGWGRLSVLFGFGITTGRHQLPRVASLHLSSFPIEASRT